MNREKIGSILLLIGIIQFIFFLHISEFLYPKYSVANNYISDLGVGPVSHIFNSSIIVLGILGVIGSYLLIRYDKIFSILLMLTSLGAAGVGLFPENMGVLHSISSLVTFLFSGITAIYSFKIDREFSRYIWVILGVISLISLGMFISHSYLGLGRGGMERMIVYPVFVWLIGISVVILHSIE